MTEQLLKRKHYNNVVRIHHYVAEAITRLKLDAFQDWLQSNGKYQVYEFAVMLMRSRFWMRQGIVTV